MLDNKIYSVILLRFWFLLSAPIMETIIKEKWVMPGMAIKI